MIKSCAMVIWLATLASCGGDDSRPTANSGGSCSPTTCASEGRSCGAMADGCGRTLNCGACIGAFTQVSAGGEHTCGVKSDGSVACWGYNGAGQSSLPPDAP